MAEARSCSNCGAPATRADSNFCTFCGSELPAAANQPAAPLAPRESLARRFSLLDAHPELESYLQYHPNTSGASTRMYGQAIGGFLFCGASVMMTFFFAALGGPLAVFPLIFVAIGLVMGLGGLKRSAEFRSAPLQRFRAAVIDERVKVSGGGNNSRARTTYFVTLEVPGGKRTEHEITEDTAAKIGAGDVGLAFLKGPILLDFLVVPV